jgi:hypothetical protein
MTQTQSARSDQGPGAVEQSPKGQFTVAPTIAKLAAKLNKLGANPVIRWPGDWLGADCLVCGDGCRMVAAAGPGHQPTITCPHGCHLKAVSRG